MSKVTDRFLTEIAETVSFTKEINATKLVGSIFRHYGFDDPAGLCDGGDYIKQIRIHIENKQGDVRISLQPMERDERWSGVLSWEEFFDFLMKAVKDSDKIEHHHGY